MRQLPTVTLCCVDASDRFDWAVRALQHSMAQQRFGDAFIVSSPDRLAAAPAMPGLRGIEAPPIGSVAGYSAFVLRDLVRHIKTEHALVVQWDGYVINAHAWTDEFLAFDYIGAPWRHVDGPHRVGNGGFSLRSRRLMAAAAEMAGECVHPEDEVICRRLRPALEARGMRFAPEALAWRFSVEHGDMSHGPYGFHGPARFPRVLGAEGTTEYLRTIREPARLLIGGGRQILRDVAAEIDAMLTCDPSFAVCRRAMADVLRRGVTDIVVDKVAPNEIERMARALIRAGFPVLAEALLQRARPMLPWLTRSTLRLRRWVRVCQRKQAGLPLD